VVDEGERQKRYCAACFSEVSAADAVCPSCGHPLSRERAFASAGPSRPVPYNQKTASRKAVNPIIPAALAAVGFFFLSPAIGYFAVGKARKAASYLLLEWAAIVISVALITWYASSAFHAGMTVNAVFTTLERSSLCTAAFGFALLGFNALMVIDVYLDARGDVTYLPDI